MSNNAKTLRQHRLEKGWTQTELARRSGLRYNVMICNYEAERSVPSGPSLQKLAAALGVNANDIDLSYAEAA